MSRLRFDTAQDVFEAFPSARGDIEAAPTADKPLDYLNKLSASESPEDAVSFSAYVLGRREAVWWACQCVRKIAPLVAAEEEKALLLAEAWVREPEEHRRRYALDFGLKNDHKLAGVWVALAAGGAGGTLVMGENTGPPVPPEMTARATRTAVLVALARTDPRERLKYIKACADLCRSLAQDSEKAT